MNLLLHVCCGPCLIEPLDVFRGQGHEVALAFANPNIAPADEYVRRLETAADYVRGIGLELAEVVASPGAWDDAVMHAATRQERCRACYRLRLGMVAREAARSGFDAIATTLTISPYQDADAIREEGRAAAAASGVEYLDRDFRDRFWAASARSREIGMYRQNYCGCAPSMQEAENERRARRMARKQDAAARNE